jgi:hypothetical protein
VNHFEHRRDKPGVIFQFTIDTAQPLPWQVYQQLSSLAQTIDTLFEQVPEVES